MRQASGGNPMRVRHHVNIILAVSLLSVAVPPTLWAAQSYTLQEIVVSQAVKAAGPNLSGQVVVRSGLVSPSSQRAKAGESLDAIGRLPSGDHTSGHAINDSGDVVGSANTKTAVRAVIWMKTGGLREIGTLPGDSASEAFGINGAGTVVGYSSGPRGMRAFAWSAKGGMQNLGTLPGGDSSKALGINDSGLVVGGSTGQTGSHAVLWNLGQIQDLGTLPGDTASEAFAVNNRGDVVGFSRGPAGMRAFLWSKGGMQSLAMLPGGTFSRANGISDTGEVVGSSGSAQGTRAVLWDAKGTPQDLNAAVSVPAGVELYAAVGINAKGQILVLGRQGHHEGPISRVFLLTPGGS